MSELTASVPAMYVLIPFSSEITTPHSEEERQDCIVYKRYTNVITTLSFVTMATSVEDAWKQLLLPGLRIGGPYSHLGEMYDIEDVKMCYKMVIIPEGRVIFTALDG
jgi:hypothetical protein